MVRSRLDDRDGRTACSLAPIRRAGPGEPGPRRRVGHVGRIGSPRLRDDVRTLEDAVSRDPADLGLVLRGRDRVEPDVPNERVPPSATRIGAFGPAVQSVIGRPSARRSSTCRSASPTPSRVRNAPAVAGSSSASTVGRDPVATVRPWASSPSGISATPFGSGAPATTSARRSTAPSLTNATPRTTPRARNVNGRPMSVSALRRDRSHPSAGSPEPSVPRVSIDAPDACVSGCREPRRRA